MAGSEGSSAAEGSSAESEAAAPSRGADCRAALLRAAAELFAHHGFEGASTRAIAARAGVPQGLIRHHFGSKHALWQRVIDDGLESLTVASPTAQGPAPLIEALCDRLAAHEALLGALTHALLEPGVRRDWLVSERLRPLLARLGPRLARSLGLPAPLREETALALIAAALAPPVFAALAAPAPTGDPAPALRRLRTLALRAWLDAHVHATPAASDRRSFGGPWGLGVAATTRK